jgi:hypothetical protein
VGVFTSSSTICNSVITNIGLDVGINNTAPAQALDVIGNVQFSGALMPGSQPGNYGDQLTSRGPNTPPVWVPAMQVYTDTATSTLINTLATAAGTGYTAVTGLTQTFTITDSAIIMIYSMGQLEQKGSTASGSLVRIERTTASTGVTAWVPQAYQMHDISGGLGVGNVVDAWNIIVTETLPAGTYTYTVVAAEDQTGGNPFYAGGCFYSAEVGLGLGNGGNLIIQVFHK